MNTTKRLIEQLEKLTNKKVVLKEEVENPLQEFIQLVEELQKTDWRFNDDIFEIEQDANTLIISDSSSCEVTERFRLNLPVVRQILKKYKTGEDDLISLIGEYGKYLSSKRFAGRG